VTTVPEGDDGPPQHENDRPEAGREYSWRSHPSDADVDATFLQIVSGIMVDGGQQRHPSGGGANALDDPDLNQDPPQESGAERARRRELRRLERAAEVAAFAAREAEVAAEREADDAHFEPPDPPPLPRPKGRTIGATLMILAGIVLLARPGLLAVEVDLTLVLAVGLILGGAVLLLTGIWRRHAGRDEDDGAVV
jgi:hypothetical protein